MVGRTEKPLARAGAHLSARRFPEAEGAFNAVLSIDPQEHRAHLGLADCACAQGDVNRAVDRLVDGASAYAERGAMRPAFALLTKALAIAPGRLDLHIDVAELEAADGRSQMAAQRLENLARTYASTGQHDEASLVLDAAAAFRTPQPAPAAAVPAPFVNPHTGHATPAPAARVAATPPPPPPASRVHAAPRHVELTPTPTPAAAMVRRSPLAAAPPPPPPPPKRARRHTSAGPRWCPSTVAQAPTKPAAKPVVKEVSVARAQPSRERVSVTPTPRPRKPAKPIARYAKKRPSITPAPSPKRGGKKLDKLPPLRGDESLARRLRATSKLPGRAAVASDEDRTAMWQRPALS